MLEPDRVPDLDNLVAAMKPYLDGLTDAGVWADDSLIEQIEPALVEHDTDEVIVTVSPVSDEGVL